MFIKHIMKNYDMGMLTMMLGISKTYNVDYVSIKGTTRNYLMDIMNARRRVKSIPIDFILMKRMISRSYPTDVIISKILKKSYLSDMLIQKERAVRCLVDVCFKGTANDIWYQMATGILNTHADCPYDLDMLTMTTYDVNYLGNIYIMSEHEMGCPFGLVTLKYDCDTVYNMEIGILKYDCDAAYDMGLMVVGAE